MSQTLSEKGGQIVSFSSGIVNKFMAVWKNNLKNDSKNKKIIFVIYDSEKCVFSMHFFEP